MRYLFLFLSILYSFIFYVFWTFSLNKNLFFKDLEVKENIRNLSLSDSIIFSDSGTLIIQSLFWNLFFEIIIFLIIWIMLFFAFSKSNLKEESENEKQEKKNILNMSNFLKLLKNFSYYIWFILFYLAFYLISLWSEIISFSFFILIVNLIIYILFFAFKNNLIVRDFLKINSIIFSLFYLVNYFYIIFTDNNYFTLVDFINSFLILLIFLTLLYFDKQITKKENFDVPLVANFSVYIFWVFLFYFYFYIFHQNIIFWISFISTFFGMIWFEVLPKINFLKEDKITLRYIWIIWTYLWIIFGMIYLWFYKFSLAIFIILFLQSVYNIFIHRKYINYVSLFFWILLIIYLFYYSIIYFNLIDYKSLNFLILGLVISFGIIIYTYILKVKVFFSYYFIHFFSHVINIVSIIIFFIFNSFDILYIWILLLLESIYFFLSYYKLNLTKKINY